MEEDTQMLLTILKHVPTCMNVADVEQLLQDRDIQVNPPVVVPARMVQDAVAAGDFPPLDIDAANRCSSQSEHILPAGFQCNRIDQSDAKGPSFAS
jgi:hypothetical protein